MLNAIETVGAERILFSADYPFEQMDVASRWLDELPLSKEVMTGIERKNAETLFKLNLA